MGPREIVITLWFFSIISLISTNIIIFFKLFFVSGNEVRVILYEKNKYLLNAEILFLILLIVITLYLLIAYFLKEHYLDFKLKS